MTSPTCLPRPVARCLRCHTATADAERINTTCGRGLGSGHCRGRLRSALRPSDWAACPECQARPLSSGQCDRCHNAGWLFTSDPTTLPESNDSECLSSARVGTAIEAELLLHAEGLRGLAYRTRRLARTDRSNYTRLLRHALELDQIADRLETEVAAR